MLVWVGNNPQAEMLVQHAARLAAADGLPWTAITIETPRTLYYAPWQRAHAVRALELAERLGASTDSLTANSVLAGIVDRARQEHVDTVMIGAQESGAMADRLQRSWLGGLAEALSDRLPGVTVHTIDFADGALPLAAAALGSLRVPAPLRSASWLSALAIVAVCTLISDLVLPNFDLANVVMVYLAGVVVVALRFGQSASMVAVIASILVFDLIFVPPRWGFNPIDPQYFFTFAVMLAVGLLISRLVDRARLQAMVAEARALRAQSLNQLARRLAAARTEQAVAHGLVSIIRSTFGVAAAVLMPGADGKLHRPSGDVAGEPATDGIDADADIARRAFDADRSAGAGAEADPQAPLMYLPLGGAGGTLGVLVVEPLPVRFGAPEDRRLLSAFADQASVAIERSLFERRSTQAVVEAEAERLRNTLLSGVSHDFRTPLTTIVGSATALLGQGTVMDSARRRMLLQSILDEARRMHATMSDLLDLTRMEEGAIQPNCEWCPADELVEEVRAMLLHRLLGRDLVAQVLPETVVWCDARLIEQVLVNLIDNALRHAPDCSTIVVRVEADADEWRLIVSDDGPGLPPGQENEVFKKFVRGPGQLAGTGTGLGLAICAAVARLHRGSITAANDPSAGVRFTLTLPQPARTLEPGE